MRQVLEAVKGEVQTEKGSDSPFTVLIPILSRLID